MTPSATLAEYVARFSYEQAPPPVIDRAKQIFVDTLGCAVAGYTAAREECGWILGLVKQLGGTPEATVWMDGFRTSSVHAALANGTMIHTVDFDDTHPGSVSHLGASLLATVLAVGERTGASGRDVLAALVAGYEVGARVGNAVNKDGRTHYRFWHPTATVGTIGAAAAAAKLMGLDADRIEQAIGLAVDQAAGFRYCIDHGDFSKSLHPGWAAMRAVLSAQLMTLGVTGPKGLLESDAGFCRATSASPSLEELTRGLGAEFEILRDALKFYPTIHCSHTAIEATLGVVARHDVAPEDVDRVDVRISDLAKGQGMNPDPVTPLAARLSIPFCVATAVLRRHVRLEDFTEEQLHDPAIRAFIPKVNVIPERAFNLQYPAGFVADLTLRTRRGREHRAFLVYPRGHPDRPAGEAEVLEKYRALTALTWPPARAEQVLGILRELEKLESVRELARCLGSP